jgi:hypothetical protein
LTRIFNDPLASIGAGQSVIFPRRLSDCAGHSLFKKRLIEMPVIAVLEQQSMGHA